MNINVNMESRGLKQVAIFLLNPGTMTGKHQNKPCLLLSYMLGHFNGNLPDTDRSNPNSMSDNLSRERCKHHPLNRNTKKCEIQVNHQSNNRNVYFLI